MHEMAHIYLHDSRSREGAWIEIRPHLSACGAALRRSRKGAWIEMLITKKEGGCTRSRSRKGAWIEISRAAGL